MFKRLKQSILNQLTQGVTPQKIAQSLTAGVLIGCFPLLGATTLLAALAGYFFKLNQIVIQAANYLMYPVQLLLIPVYIKLISTFTDVGDVPVRPDLILTLFREDYARFFKMYGWVAVYAVLLWLVVSGMAFWILNRSMLAVVSRIKRGV